MRVYDLATYREIRARRKQNLPDNQVRFSRQELRVIMAVYFRNVVAGSWRDYGISYLTDKAVFSVYRSSCGNPLYMIEKCRDQKGKANLYRVQTPHGRVMSQGRNLDRVVRTLDSSPFHLVS